MLGIWANFFDEDDIICHHQDIAALSQGQL